MPVDLRFDAHRLHRLDDAARDDHDRRVDPRHGRDAHRHRGRRRASARSARPAGDAARPTSASAARVASWIVHHRGPDAGAPSGRLGRPRRSSIPASCASWASAEPPFPARLHRLGARRGERAPREQHVDDRSDALAVAGRARPSPTAAQLRAARCELRTRSVAARSCEVRREDLDADLLLHRRDARLARPRTARARRGCRTARENPLKIGT